MGTTVAVRNWHMSDTGVQSITYDPVAEDRRRRNRESARRCRQKRKGNIRGMEERVLQLSAENVALQRENESLHQIIAKLQGAAHCDQLLPTHTNKRAKYEDRVNRGYDSSESADGVHPSGHDYHCLVLDQCRKSNEVRISGATTPPGKNLSENTSENTLSWQTTTAYSSNESLSYDVPDTNEEQDICEFFMDFVDTDMAIPDFDV